jgi:hypothetical protein
LIEGVLIGREVAVGMGNEGDAWDLQRVKQEEFGVAVGVFAEMWVCGQLCSGVGDGLAESHA